MSQSAINSGLNVKRSLLDAVLAGLIALIVFGPIVGIVLNGYSFNFEPHRLVWIIVAVMAGRLLLSLFLQTAPGRRGVGALRRWQRRRLRAAAGL